MFGAFGGALAQGSLTFVSGVGQASAEKLGLQKTLSAVRGCRSVKKADMVRNSYTPVMDIDAQTYEVRADGVLLTCEPATELPMAQRYFLF
jgi:urease subunit alpha